MFIVESGANVQMDGVTVMHTYHDTRTSATGGDLLGGMQINSNNVQITGCTFTQSHRVAMTIRGVNPEIVNCTFFSNSALGGGGGIICVGDGPSGGGPLVTGGSTW